MASMDISTDDEEAETQKSNESKMKEKRKYSCALCLKSVLNTQMMKKHTDRHIRKGDEPLCPFCGSFHTTIPALRAHMRNIHDWFSGKSLEIPGIARSFEDNGTVNHSSNAENPTNPENVAIMPNPVNEQQIGDDRPNETMNDSFTSCNTTITITQSNIIVIDSSSEEEAATNNDEEIIFQIPESNNHIDLSNNEIMAETVNSSATNNHPCDLCSMTFLEKDSRIRHIKEVHFGIKQDHATPVTKMRDKLPSCQVILERVSLVPLITPPNPEPQSTANEDITDPPLQQTLESPSEEGSPEIVIVEDEDILQLDPSDEELYEVSPSDEDPVPNENAEMPCPHPPSQRGESVVDTLHEQLSDISLGDDDIVFNDEHIVMFCRVYTTRKMTELDSHTEKEVEQQHRPATGLSAMRRRYIENTPPEKQSPSNYQTFRRKCRSERSKLRAQENARVEPSVTGRQEDLQLGPTTIQGQNTPSSKQSPFKSKMPEAKKLKHQKQRVRVPFKELKSTNDK